jgi:hypothetical protein
MALKSCLVGFAVMVLGERPSSKDWAGAGVTFAAVPRFFADSREDIVRLYNEHRAGQFERVSVGSNGRNLIYENNNRLLSIAFDGR